MKNLHTVKQTLSLLNKTLMIPQQYRATPFLWGNYGIGKSEIIRQFARKRCEDLTKQYIAEGKEDQLFKVIDNGVERMVAFDPNPVDIRLSLKDAGDIQGLPTFTVDHNNVKRTTWAMPECFPSDPKWQGVIFFDEFNLGQMNVINACYQILTEFQLEALKLHPGTLVVCAGNYIDIATNAIDLPQGINNRVNHIDMVANSEEWIEWAIQNHVNENIINFIYNNTKALYDEEGMMNGAREFATPRSWVRVSSFLNLPNYDTNDLVKDIQGIVGEPYALALHAYINKPDRFQPASEILIEGKQFKEGATTFLNTAISCLSMLNNTVDQDKLKTYIKNFVDALKKIKNKELITFVQKQLVDYNERLHNFILDTNPEIIVELAELSA